MDPLIVLLQLKTKADQYFKQKDFASAAILLKKGLILNLSDFELLHRLGELYFSMGRLEEAKFYYSKALGATDHTDRKNEVYDRLLSIEMSLQLNDISDNSHPQDFLDDLVRYLYDSLSNAHILNIDIEWLRYNRVHISDRVIVNTLVEGLQIFEHIDGLIYLYDRLDDEHSRNLLINVIAFRILGNSKVKLPLNAPDYWKRRRLIKHLVHSNDTLNINFRNWDLRLYKLDQIGYDICLYYMNTGISNTFVEKQYAYSSSDRIIKAQAGDVVIDAGGCWGDTALYFAHQVGGHGHVYTLEFIPSNLEIMKKNLELNPHLKDRITIVPHPLWDQSDQRFYFADDGPASFISSTSIEGGTGDCLTVSIDDMISRYNINKVNFIKMDIEGAEMRALKGAVKTISTFKPTLAVAVYHHASDFGNVARYISELDSGYQLFLAHYTIYREETVLFAVHRSKV